MGEHHKNPTSIAAKAGEIPDAEELPQWAIPPGAPPSDTLIVASYIGVEQLPGPDGEPVYVLRLHTRAGLTEARVLMQGPVVQWLTEQLGGAVQQQAPRLVTAQPGDVPGLRGS